MTNDLETAARDYAREVIGQFERNGVVPAFSAYNGFLAGAAHMQNKENELTQIIKWRDESIEELRQTIINERKRIEELEGEREGWSIAFEVANNQVIKNEAALTKERQISNMLEEGLNLALAQMKFTDSLDIADAATNSPTIALCSGYIAEVQKLRGEK